MKIAVVLNYNNYSATIECTRHLLNQGMDKVVIVDNHSTNNSVEYLNGQLSTNDNVVLLESKKNRGYASGNNIGLKYIQDNFLGNNDLFIVNPDSKVSKDCISKISNALNSKQNAGMISTLVNNSGDSAWHHLTPFRALIFNSLLIRRFLKAANVNEHRPYKLTGPIQKVDVISGAFFGIKQQTFAKIGFFDEGTFLFYEEEILFKKLKNNGYDNYLLTNATFSHEGHGSSSSVKRLMLKKIDDQSRLYLLRKYYNVSNGYSLAFRLCNVIDNQLLKMLKKDS